MPPKKRALAEISANQQPPKKRQSTGNDASQADQENRNGKEKASKGDDLPDDHISQRPPYQYITMQKPFYISTPKSLKIPNKDGMFNHLATAYPTWPYKLMASSWRKLCDWIRMTSYTDPDNFDMYIYNDWHAYGIMELLENLLIEIHDIYKKSKKGEQDLEEMWCVVSVMGHWLNHPSSEPVIGIDDGERMCETVGVVGAAVLAVLEEIDRAGELRGDSERFRDLGLVMALFVDWGTPLPDYGIEESQQWIPSICAYAKKAGIDLKAQGIEDVKTVNAKPLSKAKAIDRWSFKKKFKDLSPSGGEDFNIVLLPRKDRVEYSFSKKDPFADIPEKNIIKAVREGTLMLQ